PMFLAALLFLEQTLIKSAVLNAGSPRSGAMGVRSRHLAILGVAAVGGNMLFIAPRCGFLFKCGGGWDLGGADKYCNVHHPLPPHCPWCAHGTMGFILPMVGLTLGQFGGGLIARRLGASVVIALLITPLSIIPAGVFLGFLTVLLSSYPHFFLS